MGPDHGVVKGFVTGKGQGDAAFRRMARCPWRALGPAFAARAPMYNDSRPVPSRPVPMRPDKQKPGTFVPGSAFKQCIRV
jgi:hypothetical protein